MKDELQIDICTVGSNIGLNKPWVWSSMEYGFASKISQYIFWRRWNECLRGDDKDEITDKKYEKKADYSLYIEKTRNKKYNQ